MLAPRKNTAKYNSPASEPQVPGAGSLRPSGPSVAQPTTKPVGKARLQTGCDSRMAA